MKLRQTVEEEKSNINDNKPIQRIFAQGDPKWTSPSYSKSRAISLNSSQVIENRCIGINPDSAEIESYKVLRTQILHRTREKGWNTVMITSARKGEGKTLTAINLSFTFAREFNQTVLLVDSDLKQQMIHRYLGFPSEKGLIDYLVEDQPLSDLIIWPGIEKMTLISGGRKFQDSTELLGSPRMRDLVLEMKNRYEDRYVLFDVPPILGGADALAFTPLVDCILMVVETDKTSMNDIKHALSLIPQEKFLGFVMNRHRSN